MQNITKALLSNYRMNKALYSLFVFLISCSNNWEGGNDFDGGSYSIQLMDCDNDRTLEEFRVERYANRIVITEIGQCPQKNHKLLTNSSIENVGDTLFMLISVTQEYTGSEEVYPMNDCICENIHEFRFDKDIDPTIPIEFKRK